MHYNYYITPLSRRLALRRQPKSSGAAVSRKTDGASPSQPKLSRAAAAKFFRTSRGMQ